MSLPTMHDFRLASIKSENSRRRKEKKENKNIAVKSLKIQKSRSRFFGCTKIHTEKIHTNSEKTRLKSERLIHDSVRPISAKKLLNITEHH